MVYKQVSPRGGASATTTITRSVKTMLMTARVVVVRFIKRHLLDKQTVVQELPVGKGPAVAGAKSTALHRMGC